MTYLKSWLRLALIHERSIINVTLEKKKMLSWDGVLESRLVVLEFNLEKASGNSRTGSSESSYHNAE